MNAQKKILIAWMMLLTAMELAAQTTLYPAKADGKWGFINRSGQLVIAADYDYVGDFREGYAIVQQAGRSGLMDTTGRLLVPCRYEWLDRLNDTLLLVRDAGEWKIQSTDAQRVYLHGITGDIQLLPNGYLLYEQITGVGLAHLQRGEIIAPHYSKIISTNNNHFIVYNEDKQGVIDVTGKMILAAEFDTIVHQGSYFAVQRDKRWGLSDTLGQWVLQPVWDKIRPINAYFWELQRHDKRSIYAVYCQKTIVEHCDRAQPLPNCPFWLKPTIYGKTGIVDSAGQWVIPAQYQALERFSDALWRVQAQDKWGLFSLSQQELVMPIECDFIGNLDRTVAIAARQGKQGVIKATGEWTLEPQYDNLPLLSNVVHFKNKENKMLTWEFDEQGNLVNEHQYNNVYSIRVRGNGSSASTTTTTAQTVTQTTLPEYIINDSLIWFFDPRLRLWGIRNIQTQRYKMPPRYSTYRNYRDLGFSIVSYKKMEAGGSLEFEGQELVMDEVFAIVHNERALPITKTEFIEIRISDLTEKGLPVARCIFVGGKHGLIARSGKVIASGYAFIGDFVEGKARACPKGTLLVDIHQRQPRHVGQFSSYFNQLDGNRHFSSLNNPTIEQALLRDGVLYCEEGKWGYLDTLGKLSIPAQFDYADDFHQSVAAVRKEGKWGLLGADNNLVLPTIYDDLNYLPNSQKQLFFAARNHLLTGVLDTTGRIVVPVQYERIRDYREGLAAVRKSEKWGFVDAQGKEVIPCLYRAVLDFSEGLAAVQHKGRWGFMNRSGDWVIEPKYSAVGNFKDGLAWVRDNKYRYVNTAGQAVIEGEFSRLYDFEQGVARVLQRGQGAGLIRLDGSWLVEPKKQWDDIEAFDSTGMARVRIGQRYELLHRAGEQPSRRGYAEIRCFSEGFAVMRPFIPGTQRNSRFGLIDAQGKVRIAPRYDWLGDVHDGRIWFKEKGKYGYLDTAGKVVVPAIYHRAYDFQDEKALVYTEYKHSGMIDLQGNYLVRPLVNKIMARTDGILLVQQARNQFFYVSEDLKRLSPTNFQQAQPFQSGVAAVQIQQKWGLMNEQGIFIGVPKYQKIQPFNDQGHALVQVHRWEGVVNLQGKVILPPNYEYIQYVGDGLFRIEQNNQLGYMDDQGQWIWEMQE